MKKILFIFLILLLIPTVLAQQGSLKLLAVKEHGDELIGTTADLTLSINPGSGRVFLETYPLSKLDTQISTRFAKEIACQKSEIDCSQYDFFYTIESNAPIVGGPSAGAAISALTYILLNNYDYDDSIAVTGTINSGGLVGSVGGILEKLEAAADLSLVLIPVDESTIEKDNETIDVQQYADNISVNVAFVSDIDDMIYYFSGVEIPESNGGLIVNEQYTSIMKNISDNLCNKANELNEQLSDLDFNKTEYNSTLTKINESFTDAEQALTNEQYYARASYCYGINVFTRILLLQVQELEESEREVLLNFEQNRVDNLEDELKEKQFNSLSSFETYAIVRERILEAKQHLESAEDSIDEDDFYKYLGNAIERIYSAQQWMLLFEMETPEFIFDEASLKDSCLKKIAEAEERYQYVNYYFPNLLTEKRKDIEVARDDYESGEYELCLFKASKAKAEFDVIINVIGISEDSIPSLVDRKLEFVENIIIEQTNKGNFPIIGYSYYQYSGTLKEDDPYSALIYLEYAQELSNLDMYFEQQVTTVPKIIEEKEEIKGFDWSVTMLLIFFLVIGVLIGILIVLATRKK